MERLTDTSGQLYACVNNLCEEGMSCSECRYRIEAETKLTAYEEAEEQGRLVMLPCKVGDKVYYIVCNNICETTVENILIDRFMNKIELSCGMGHRPVKLINKTLFLTREEAENALKERESND